MLGDRSQSIFLSSSKILFCFASLGNDRPCAKVGAREHPRSRFQQSSQ
jgi:hypothetical protein